VTNSKGSGPQFWDTVYISEVNGDRKVKSDAQNKNLFLFYKQEFKPNAEIFRRGGWGQCLQLNFFSKLMEFETNRAKKFILLLLVTIRDGTRTEPN